MTDQKPKPELSIPREQWAQMQAFEQGRTQGDVKLIVKPAASK